MANKVAYHNTVINESGAGVLATITVYNAGTLTKPTIYSSPAGAAQDNPLATDSLGRFVFYADPGEYDIEVSGAGIVPYTLENVSIIGVFEQFVVSDPPATNYRVKKIRLGPDGKVVVVYNSEPEA